MLYCFIALLSYCFIAELPEYNILRSKTSYINTAVHQ